MPEPPVNKLQRYLRNPRFLLILVPGTLAWLAVMAWLVWLKYSLVFDWIGRQNEFVQEGASSIVLLILALVFGLGIGGVIHVAEWVAGLRAAVETWQPGPLPAGAKKWARGRNSLPPPADPRAD